MIKKEYIGDGLYAEFDGFAVIVTSENGFAVLDTVVFEPSTLDALNNYFRRAQATPAPAPAAGEQEQPR